MLDSRKLEPEDFNEDRITVRFCIMVTLLHVFIDLVQRNCAFTVNFFTLREAGLAHCVQFRNDYCGGCFHAHSTLDSTLFLFPYCRPAKFPSRSGVYESEILFALHHVIISPLLNMEASRIKSLQNGFPCIFSSARVHLCNEQIVLVGYQHKLTSSSGIVDPSEDAFEFAISEPSCLSSVFMHCAEESFPPSAPLHEAKEIPSPLS